MKQRTYISHKVQNIKSGEISNCTFETYKNYVRPRGCYINNTTANMAMSTICPCTSEYHGILHCKCLLRYFDKFSSIFVPSQEANKDTTNKCPKKRFLFYCIVLCCTVHGRCTYHKLKTCSLFFTVPSSYIT